MATTIFYAGLSDNFLLCDALDYATSRAGDGNAAIDPATALGAYAGQEVAGSTYRSTQYFVSIDTSALRDDATVTAVAYSVYNNGSSYAANFTEEVRAYNWGASVDSTDWRPGSTLSGYTLCATRTLTTAGETGGLKSYSQAAGFPGQISKTGTTYLFHTTDRQRVGNVPSGTERVWVQAADQTGTTNDPRVTVTWTGITQELASTRAGAATASGTASIKHPLAASRAGAATVSGTAEIAQVGVPTADVTNKGGWLNASGGSTLAPSLADGSNATYIEAGLD